MICIVINGPTYKQAKEDIKRALHFADLFELRLDLFNEINLSSIKELLTSFSKPFILTVRTKEQGGKFEGNYENVIQNLVQLNPAYIDVEKDFLLPSSSVKPIFSYHNFKETPKDLEKFYSPNSLSKIAVMANSTSDALRLLEFKKDKPNLIAIAMGPLGQCTRILGPVFGNPFTYASIEDEIAPGMLSAEVLLNQYHYKKLNYETQVYGLLGDPVDQSISDITHNAAFNEFNAVYVKLQTKVEELEEVLKYAKKLSFKGLSITMPLKEEVCKFVRHSEPYQAINTLKFSDEIYGINTDGMGAIKAIGLVKNKKVIILGAGGAAISIAHQAKKKGALLTILNRDIKKAKKLAIQLNCHYGSLKDKQAYDILINCTPHPMPISKDFILPDTIIMDIKTKTLQSELLSEAKRKNCRIIYGYKMFIQQAILQFDYWFKESAFLR